MERVEEKRLGKSDRSLPGPIVNRGRGGRVGGGSGGKEVGKGAGKGAS